MQPAIRVEGLSKLYHVGARQQGYTTLRESIADACWSPINRLRNSLTRKAPLEVDSSGADQRLSGGDFWALKDVSFEVQPGEVVGIVGRNGAGKSTLLKILSRITEPTRGRIELRGRIGSLLEVGTGFHAELSGRENIYMNGSILGMSRREIAKKFDEIVAFAEVEDFLDTPVKRYSSGMYVRLAFAVAAHLEPEILIVDEVLAVGDINFQRKCIGKMREVATHGRTVLFVSHNIASLETLCSMGVELKKGRVETAGDIHSVLHHYRANAFAERQSCESLFANARFFRSACLLDKSGNKTDYVPLGGEFHLSMQIGSERRIPNPVIIVAVNDSIGQRMLTVHTPVSSIAVDSLLGTQQVSCRIPVFPLAPGEYVLKLVLSELHEQLDVLDGVVPFAVSDGELFGEGRGFHRGVCIASSHWSSVAGDRG